MRKLLPFNEDNFHNIAWKEGLAVVRFHAPWCPPCHSSENLFNEFAEHIESNVTVGVVNVDQSPVLANRYEIWGLPSVLMFKDGQLIQRIVGVKPLTDYQNALEELMKLDSNGFEDIDQETIGSLCLTNSNSHPE